MIEETKDKLEEARFFLSKLREQQAAQARLEKPPASHFRYCLNAFIISARSVKWFLEREGKQQERKKYEAWINGWNARLQDAENALDGLAIEMRDTAVHRGLVQTKVRSTEVPVSRRQPSPGSGTFFQPARLRQSSPSWTVSEFHYVELQGKELEIVEVCERYIDLLTRMVTDFTNKHPI
jgi:hypothetical protein